MTTTSGSSTFSIQGKGLKFDTKEQVMEFADQLRSQSASLKEICLSGNTFGVEAAVEIASAFGTNASILLLSDMFTSRLKSEIPLALDALVLALEKMPNLVHLDLSDNAFGPAGAKPLMRLIINNRNIKVLKLNNNGLGIEGARLISEALKEAHELNVSEGRPDALEVVVFGRNRMESPGCEHLAKALQLYKGSLIHIQMPQNSIRPEGIAFLINCIKDCSKLEFLDLQDNTFTKIGSSAIAKAFVHWPVLKQLNLGDCLLGGKGGILVINGLASNTTLERIALFFNEINDKGARLVPAMLANKTSLKTIELNGNTFEAEGDAVTAIRETLDRIGKGDALDELDEMEEADEDEEEEEEDEDEEETAKEEVKVAKKEDVEVDDLTAALGKATV